MVKENLISNLKINRTFVASYFNSNYMKKLFTFLLFLFIVTQQLLAVPAYPHPIKFQLPDNTTITITLKGDENVSWATSEDGYTLLLNSEGYYEYAIKNENGDLTLSGFRAKDINERSSEEIFLVKNIEKDLRYSGEQIYYMLQIRDMRHTIAKSIKEKSNSGGKYTGQVSAPLILVGFQGKPFTSTQNDFELLMNQPNYTAGGTITGSVYDYFYATSYEQLQFTVDVFGPFTMSHAIGYYDNKTAGGDSRLMATEAANAAHAAGCNFANYDIDNDGYVDGIHIIFAGYGQEAGAPAGQAIWSHAWAIYDNYLMLDGKRVYRFSCSPEYRGTTGNDITYIGVIAHELSHVFGLPDLYDTDYDGSGGTSIHMMTWDIMSTGSWNDGGRTPPYHSAWCRNDMGWVNTVTLSAPATITIPNPANTGASYRIDTSWGSSDYFLVENRQKTGWDAFIATSGMLIYHVDEDYDGWYDNCINCDPSHRGLYIKQANGGPDSNSSDQTNAPYPHGSNNSFTDTSVPNSLSWYGTYTNKPITNITHNTTDSTITFDFMAGSPLQYSVSVSANPAEGGTVSGGGNYYSDSQVAVHAYPNTHYSFVDWKKDGITVSTNWNYSFTITENTTLVANFARNNANLSSLTVSSGTLAPNFNPSTTNYTVNVANAVSTITITGVTQDPSATVAGNITNAAINVGDNNFTIKVTAVDGTIKDYNVNVIRATLLQHEITASVENNIGGNISPSGTVIVDDGNSITFQINSDTDYIIEYVLVDGGNVGNNNFFTFENVSTNHNIIAKFKSILSIENIEIKQISIYPNPTNSYVTIESEDVINSFVIFNSLGVKLLENKNVMEKSFRIDIEDFASGIYFIRIDGETRKLIKE